jgi:hypothetical protein
MVGGAGEGGILKVEIKGMKRFRIAECYLIAINRLVC